MTREEAKRLLPIIQAFADGKTVQYRISATFPRRYIRDFSYLKEWNDINEENFNGFIYDGTVNYRIKPEPKYRPFKSQEECWDEMLKHKPFGWVKNIETGDLCNISNIYESEGCSKVFLACVYTFSSLLNEFTFIDGTPFGIKEKINTPL